jgi:hypothetical protein
MRFFFYGTLLDRDVTALVLGRRLPPQAFVPAVLSGYSRWRVQGGSYPIAVRDLQGEIEGAVVSGLSPRDVRRLTAYEGPGYRTVLMKVRLDGVLRDVFVFEPLVSKLQPTNRPWQLKLWQRDDKKAFIDRIRPRFNEHREYSRP